MSVKHLVERLKKVNDDIGDLYKEKRSLENQILDAVDVHIIKYKETLDETHLENIEITVDNLVMIGLLYRNSLNHELLKEKHPDVYMWGRKIVFDYNTALLSFRNKKKFWKVITECTERKEKVTVKPLTNKKRRKNE